MVSTITNFVTDKRIYLDYFCKRYDEYPDVGMQPFDSEPYHAPKGNS
ncbi:MAG: isochorismate synthase [Microcystis aeruginosa BS13-02]|nr:isochorismate synthase [Microcystis aeruginosa BS13-02]